MELTEQWKLVREEVRCGKKEQPAGRAWSIKGTKREGQALGMYFNISLQHYQVVCDFCKSQMCINLSLSIC